VWEHGDPSEKLLKGTVLKPKTKPGRILVLIAARDEANGIGPTLNELSAILQEVDVVVVDGGSRDRTVEIAKDCGAHVIAQQDEGKGDALRRALPHIDRDPEYVVLIDADYTYPAKAIPEMVDLLDRYQGIGMVCGNRFNAHFRLRGMKNMFYFGNRFLASMHNLLNGVQMRDPLTGLRVVRWSLLKKWTPRSKGFDIEVELNHHVERQGYNIVEVPIYYRPRLGEKKLKMRHGVRILRRILAESLSQAKWAERTRSNRQAE
jgi:glycosyltransferase involved in cell wall biosynthesis